MLVLVFLLDDRFFVILGDYDGCIFVLWGMVIYDFVFFICFLELVYGVVFNFWDVGEFICVG